VIDVRAVVTEADIDTYLELRNGVQPQSPMPVEWVHEQRKKPDNLGARARAREDGGDGGGAR
jgi:hypothetical protein